MVTQPLTLYIYIYTRTYVKVNYQASCDNFEEEACCNGAKQLGNPVEDASEDGDLTTKSQSEGDSWVDMTTRDVGTH